VMRALVERGDLYRAGGHWERKAVDAIEVPESVRSVIGQRLERLSEQTQEILAEASVLGQTFAFQELVGVGARSSQRSETDVERALDEAENIGLVRELSRDLYGFDHALTQQALYRELSSRQRRRLHGAAGEAIEALPERKRRRRTAELSRHFLEGDDLPRALTYTVAAAEEAAAVFAHEETESLFRAAVELAREVGERAQEARALAGLGSVLGVLARYAEARRVLISAAELFRGRGDREAEMRAEAEIGHVHLRLGEADAGIGRLSAALAGARERGDILPGSPALAAATSMLARLYWIKGDLDTSLSTATLAADLARAAGDNRVLAEAETRRGTILQSMDRTEESLATLDHAIAIAEEAGALDVLTTAANNATVGYYMNGQWDRAERYQRRALAASERFGDPDNLAFVLRGLAFVLIGRGDWREARELAERAVRLSDAVGDSWGRPYVLTALAYLNVFEGRLDEATVQVDEAWQSARGRDDLTAMSTVCWGQSWLSLLQGQPEQVVARAQPLLDNPRIDVMYRLILRELVARAWIDLGDPARAEALARQAVERSREDGTGLLEAATLPTLGRALARQGRTDEAREVFERAIELSRPMPHPFNEAIARYEWGCMLAEVGDAGAARAHLDAALILFRRLGAVPFIERTERALASL
jgi:tetratricopeptide (TPR) repeat protein